MKKKFLDIVRIFENPKREGISTKKLKISATAGVARRCEH